MSQNDKKTPAKTHKKTSKPSKPQEALKRLKGIPLGIKKSILNTIAELKKVTWPTRQDLINYTIVVVVFMVLLGILVGVLDLGASAVVKLLVGV